MKIGVVTFYRVPNYGAMLQAFALQSYLESLDHEVVFLKSDFTAKHRYLWYDVLLSRGMGCLKRKLQFNLDLKICDGFATRFAESDELLRYKKKHGTLMQCDAYIVGSDQMWNPAWCHGYLEDVLLDFVPDGAKRLAYAVSFGTTTWPEESKERVGKLLCKFDAISVREASGVELVRELSGVRAEWLPDPTLLHNVSFYNRNFGVRHENNGTPYLFKHLLHWPTTATNPIEETIFLTLQLREVKTARRWSQNRFFRRIGVDELMESDEWLEAIANSSFVLSNSFHCILFAVLYRKPFVVLPVEGDMAGMNERIVSVLTLLGLESRILYAERYSQLQEILSDAIAWESVHAKIDAFRSKATGFINNNLPSEVRR